MDLTRTDAKLSKQQKWLKVKSKSDAGNDAH